MAIARQVFGWQNPQLTQNVIDVNGSGEGGGEGVGVDRMTTVQSRLYFF